MKVFQGECEYQSLMYVCRFAVVVVAIATTIGIQKSRRNHKTFATELQIGNEFILFECISAVRHDDSFSKKPHVRRTAPVP